MGHLEKPCTFWARTQFQSTAFCTNLMVNTNFNLPYNFFFFFFTSYSHPAQVQVEDRSNSGPRTSSVCVLYSKWHLEITLRGQIASQLDFILAKAVPNHQHQKAQIWEVVIVFFNPIFHLRKKRRACFDFCSLYLTAFPPCTLLHSTLHYCLFIFFFDDRNKFLRLRSFFCSFTLFFPFSSSVARIVAVGFYEMRRPGPSYSDNPHRFLAVRPTDYCRRQDKQLSTPVRDRANFTISLRLAKTKFSKFLSPTSQNQVLRGLIEKLETKPLDYSPPSRLYFQQWNDTLSCVIALWKLRFDGVHDYTPEVHSHLLMPSDVDELNEQLKILFKEIINYLSTSSDEVVRWERKLVALDDEVRVVISKLKSRGNNIRECGELVDEKEGLRKECELVRRRLEEFRSGMKCLEHLLDGRIEDNLQKLALFRMQGEFDWGMIYCLIIREVKRFKDGLPIYAYRTDILELVNAKQIVILIGETGSGKSTQLVQYLADSGQGSSESIVCTQPRKLAAISLADRVNEEVAGCCRDDSIIFCPAFSSTRCFDSKVMFMTDHCLLQHYMNDKNLSGVSCIIIDEAHERSLNTDLLLALVKELLCKRIDLRLIIMSATADAQQFSEYLFGCESFFVSGRKFPVDIKYAPSDSCRHSDSGITSLYLSDVLRTAVEIHKSEKEGTVLAFLTSQSEVEWACENFVAPGAIALPLHGKLSFEEQFRVFQNYPGKRKVIFATNLAETSLTIPGVKYVIDSGMVKESKFEPGTGMNVLRVGRISQSAANQRAGRAGRTEPGWCYRLYSERDYDLMVPHQEPEIRRVHLGIAILRIFALGIKNVQSFDFIDAPSPEAINMAIRNLIQLGAVEMKNDTFVLTEAGRYFVKLGIEPRLGKLILGCFQYNLRREGLVLAAVMANSSSIFCRVGSDANKLKSDSLKVQFCHQNGDLFTLLSVYKEWEGLPVDKRNRWCWDNSINGKSMRRCLDTVVELEICLRHELNVIIPSYWVWSSQIATENDKYLKNVILSALSENVAMHSGYDRLGYEVALTGGYVQLHPSCSLLVFGQRPSWIVFGEILSVSKEYLVCVTSVDVEHLSVLRPPPLFDASKMVSQKLQIRMITGFGSTLLKKFCGKSKSNLHHLEDCLQRECGDTRIGIEVNVEENDIILYATSSNLEKAYGLVNDMLQCEKKWLKNECMERCLYKGGTVALFGAGAEIKHLELEKRCLSVDVYCSNAKCVVDKELVLFFERCTSGDICTIHKYNSNLRREGEENEKWGRLTFLTPEAAERATELNGTEFSGSVLKVIPSQTAVVGDGKYSFPAVRAKIYWPRRCSRGVAIVKCDANDVQPMLDQLHNLQIGGIPVRCEASRKKEDGVVITRIDKRLTEHEILEAVRRYTDRKVLDLFVLRGDSVGNPPCPSCEEAILREILTFMPKQSPSSNCCLVQVFPPDPADAFIKAMIIFDGRLHLEAAKALEELEGRVLPGFLPWQKIMCQQVFSSSVFCPASLYPVIQKQLDSLLARFKHRKGVECKLDRNENGSYRVRISANATKTVAEVRRPLEELMRGRIIDHSRLTPSVLLPLFSWDGISLIRSLQQETGTYILFDRHAFNVRIFGPPAKMAIAERKLVQSLLTLHENKQLEIHLRGRDLRPDLMKEVVKKFGPDLQGLKEEVPGVELLLNTRRHIIFVHGNVEQKQKLEEVVYSFAQTSDELLDNLESEAACPICLCEVEDNYCLEGCGHTFCRQCLLGQCESAIKRQDSFPMLCTHKDCKTPILLTDLKSLLPSEKLEELFRASLGAFVGSSGGSYKFCPSPDCPSVYKVAAPGTDSEPFVCGACHVETCRSCHLEYHPCISCEMYQEFKVDPDSSLKEWRKDKEHVKNCPVCGRIIEKVEGCNHVECLCKSHVCWVCLEAYGSSDDCYNHLRSVHLAIM